VALDIDDTSGEMALNSGIDGSSVALWTNKRVFVLGDVMLDRFVYGDVERISPEAPIPVLHFESEKFMLGGAANVARNIVALGGQATLAGVVGDDASGDLIANTLVKQDGVDGRFVRLRGQPTTVKTRYVSGGQQIMRLDIERKLTLEDAAIAEICDSFERASTSIDAVVLSDYNKGVLSAALVARIIGIARDHGIPVVADPKNRDVRTYAGASVLTPNASEAAAFANIACDTDASAEKAAKIIRDRAEVDAVVITRGGHGMTIYNPGHGQDKPLNISTIAREVFDVSGAGDTVVATLSLALAGGLDVTTAARIANVAAGIVVGKKGTAVVSVRELMAALTVAAGADPKIVAADEAASIAADWRESGLRVGFTNGCFDLLHPGHVELIKRARATCDKLVVGLNADASVRRLKGPSRPVQNERARSIVMASISSVDLVTLFAEDTPLGLIERLKPDVLVKGADYTIETVVGADFVRGYGGKVVLVPIEVGYSTTTIIGRAGAETSN
jgi:D-beta-D-heptose 7-phosphate kinase/D-beta-D-heptose 1-phosphate adenosyltransferase